MRFIKFPSIKLITQRHIHNVMSSELGKERFMCTEKVHGSNMAMYSNGVEAKFASREGFVPDDRNLYDGRRVFKEHEAKLKELARDELSALGFPIGSDSHYIILTGELYGGGVQRGMPYQMEQKFVLFDFVVVAPTSMSCRDDLNHFGATIHDVFPEDGSASYSIIHSHDKISSFDYLEEDYKFECVKPMFVGTLEECMNINHTFDTTYACEDRIKESGLTGEALKNFMTTEGFVIEPVKPTVMYNERIMYKRKTERFKEKEQVDRDKPSFIDRLKARMTEDEVSVMYELSSMLTVHRLETTISKIGDVTIKDFGKVLKSLLDDIYKELDEFLEEDESYEQDKFKDFANYKDMASAFSREAVKFIQKPLLEMG